MVVEDEKDGDGGKRLMMKMMLNDLTVNND